MFKMALPALNMITSDSQVDDVIGTVEALLKSFRMHHMRIIGVTVENGGKQ